MNTSLWPSLEISCVKESWIRPASLRTGWSRRDVLCNGLTSAGWPVRPPRATMFVWAQVPEFYREMGSLEFSKKLLADARVAVSPGVGFGEYGEGYVRFGLIENEHRTRQAIRNIRRMIKQDGFA